MGDAPRRPTPADEQRISGSQLAVEQGLTDCACEHGTRIVRFGCPLRDIHPLEVQLGRQLVFEPIDRRLSGDLDPNDSALARLREQTADRRAADAELLRDLFLRSLLDVVEVRRGDDERSAACGPSLRPT